MGSKMIILHEHDDSRVQRALNQSCVLFSGFAVLISDWGGERVERGAKVKEYE